VARHRAARAITGRLACLRLRRAAALRRRACVAQRIKQRASNAAHNCAHKALALVSARASDKRRYREHMARIARLMAAFRHGRRMAAKATSAKKAACRACEAASRWQRIIKESISDRHQRKWRHSESMGSRWRRGNNAAAWRIKLAARRSVRFGARQRGAHAQRRHIAYQRCRQDHAACTPYALLQHCAARASVHIWRANCASPRSINLRDRAYGAASRAGTRAAWQRIRAPAYQHASPSAMAWRGRHHARAIGGIARSMALGRRQSWLALRQRSAKAWRRVLAIAHNTASGLHAAASLARNAAGANRTHGRTVRAVIAA